MNNILISKEQSRQHVRLQLTDGLIAHLRLCEVDGKPVKSKPGRVLIIEISPAGLVFQSFLKFPVASNYRIQFEFDMNRKPLVLTGRIARCRKRSNAYEYGVDFTMSLAERAPLFFALNQLLLQQSPAQEKIHKMYQQL